MRSFLVGLWLLLACVLVWGTSVMEDEKECCGPGVPLEKSCCLKDNSTSQEPEGQKEPAVPAEPDSEIPNKQMKIMPFVPEEPNSEEMERRGEEYRRMMQNSRSSYESTHLKQISLDYFNKRSSGAFYRPIEDMDVKVQSATGTILSFTQLLVNTNCTKEEGRRSSDLWYEYESAEKVPCAAVPIHSQKKVKCRVYMFIEARSRRSTVFRHDCEPVVFWEGSDDTLDNLDQLLDFSPPGFGPSF